MKTEDFERLKALCEKEGFTIESYSGGKTAIIGVKDPWEGVEFVEILVDWNGFKVGSIGRIIEEKFNGYIIFSPIGESNSSWNPNAHYAKDLEVIKPSTEEAYVEQLKKQAFERFGEIKEGDRFKLNDSISEITDMGITSWIYRKETDAFGKHGVVLYQKGKWAERVKERVEVSFSGCHHEEYKSHLAFQSEFFVYNNRGFDPKTASIFLAQQLEKYLNNEID